MILNKYHQKPLRLLAYLCIALLATHASISQAKPKASVKMSVERTENPSSAETLILPYAFSTEDMGLTAGFGAMASGTVEGQEQMTIGGTLFAGDSTGGAFAVFDYNILNSKRFYFSIMGMVGNYPLIRAYAPVPNDPIAPDEIRPGSNDSDVNDYFSAKGSNSWWEMQLDYVLPLGAAENNPVQHYELTAGLLTSSRQVKSWNPLETGITIATLRQFNRFQRYERETDELKGEVHAVEFGLMYDNTDFPVNPSQGSSQYFAFTYDPGKFGSSREWTNVSFETSHYFDLGPSSISRQQVLAVNAWTSYSPSWQLEYDEQGNSTVVDGPQFLEGAGLGGMYRMRGYSQNRFHDKAAIYATVEYRNTLAYNPIKEVKWLRFLKLDWFQIVPFIEGGRVAPEYDVDNLFSDWKVDAGVSIRALTAGIVTRLDIAVSNEGTNAWVMVGHPF